MEGKDIIQLIIDERLEHFWKHNRTIEDDVKHNSSGQLIMGTIAILTGDISRFPTGWNIENCKKMINGDKQKRIIKAISLLLAEYERIEELKRMSNGDL